MRYLALAIVLAACAAPRPPALPPATVTPARDLADARSAAPRGDAHDTKLTARDPRVVDLDIIRITAHAKSPGGDLELTSVASADLFKQANEAAKAGRQRDAIATYRQLVTEFPESQFAPISLFNIAAIYDAQADLTATLTTLDELVAKYPTSRESIDGHLYMAALRADHKQWPAAAATLDAILARSNLT